MDTVLVTGATGFIGSHVCRLLVEQGYHVRVFHRSTSRLQLLEGLPVEHVTGDLTRPDALPAALTGVDYLIHTAAVLSGNEKTGQMYTVNVEGTRSLMRAALAAGVKRVVVTSSVSTLGVPELPEAEQPQPLLMDENHTWNYKAEYWPYAYAKYLAELEVQKAVADGLDAVIVNPTLVFGPGDLYKQTSSLVVQVAQRKVPFLIEGGLNVVHVADVAAGHLAALQHGKKGERYILGGENISIADLITLTAEISAAPLPDNILPAAAARWLSEPLSWFQTFISAPIPVIMLKLAGYYFYVDCGKARQSLNWQPQKNTRQALSEAYDWFNQQGCIQGD